MTPPAGSIVQRAIEAHRRGDLAEAARLYRRALDLDPAAGTASLNLAAILMQAGRLGEAETILRAALERQPDFAEAQYNLGFVLHERGELDGAIEAYRRALALRPDMPEIHTNLGVALQQQDQLDAAVAALRQAITCNPRHVAAHFNLAVALAAQSRLDEAAAAYGRVLALEPSHVEARNNLALVLSAAGDLAAASTLQWQVVKQRSDYPEGWNNLGAILLDRSRTDEAVDALQHCLKLQPDYAEAQLNLGNAYRELDLLQEAIGAYRRALELRPGYAEALAQLVYHRARACDWSEFEADQERLLDAVRQRTGRVPPFTLVASRATAADQLLCARQWAAQFTLPDEQILPAARWPAHDRLRIGYLSADFHAHATASLIGELIERHDRDRFAIYGYSYGADPGGELRAQLASAFERFDDLQHLPHRQAAERIRRDEIDVLIDLKGYTHRARPNILAYRPAPVQVNYLGYPGTMGAPFIDYIIADAFIVPPDAVHDFSERVTYLADCYQPNDTRREIVDAAGRATCGLPAEGFVFCAFNNSFKITPQVFAIWTRLLKNISASVLWLLESNPLVSGNLRSAAAAEGVDPARLVFAPIMPHLQHLARHRHADIFLDTLPCNAHTTASDALWAGLPVLTCAGATFAGRVAGSIVGAAGLSELVTHSPAEYEALALTLAREPWRLAALRNRLSVDRPNLPLFDMRKRARELERLYARMVALWRSGARLELPGSDDAAGRGA